ncbi:RNA 2',3'-cyclic phosphodiesterase [Candidatus Micrarchaeota archaeon]|nr:RNA 2',3'-cyclic phosphodiesterase [Candidatus Micrarchaeota archaeon]
MELRTFISIEVPEDIKKKIIYISKKLEMPGVVRVNPKIVHFTLKFLGDVKPDKLSKTEGVLSKIKFKPFNVRIKGAGVFPNEGYIKVVWLGAKSPEMTELAEKINETLSELFASEENFVPHLTIARVKRKINLKPFLDEFRDTEIGKFKAKSFFLMYSELTPSGPRYRILREYPAEE